MDFAGELRVDLQHLRVSRDPANAVGNQTNVSPLPEPPEMRYAPPLCAKRNASFLHLILPEDKSGLDRCHDGDTPAIFVARNRDHSRWFGGKLAARAPHGQASVRDVRLCCIYRTVVQEGLPSAEFGVKFWCSYGPCRFL